MGTRADLYLGKGPEAQWIGSVSTDGDPASLPSWLFAPVQDSLYQTAEEIWKERVETFLRYRYSEGRWIRRAVDGWPWPWPDSSTTDCTYTLHDGLIWCSWMGPRPWFVVQPDLDNCGQPWGEDDLRWAESGETEPDKHRKIAGDLPVYPQFEPNRN